MDKITLLSTVGFTGQQLDRLRAVSPRLDVQQITNPQMEDIPAELRQRVEILYGWAEPVRQAHLFPNLRWIQTHSAGVDFLLDKPVWQSRVIITNLSGVHAVPMAEHVLAMMLAFRWNLPKMERLRARAEWPQGRWDHFARPELRGSTLGIIGYGAIGRELARQAHALGMRVLATNRSGQRHPQRGFNQPGVGDPDGTIPEKMYPTAQLKQMLPECDYVASAIPLTGETRHLMNAETFAVMKKSAYFFNVGRGQVVDEAALVAALQQGHLAGAGLDVFEQEPLPPESPLWQLEQVIISPHVSGFTTQYDTRASFLFAENVRRYLAQEPLLNLVDREKGY